MRRALSVPVPWLALVVLAWGCGSAEQEVVHLDLLTDLPGLEKSVETTNIDFEAENARARLRRGFSAVLRDEARDAPFVRSEGRRSSVRFTLVEARALELTLRGRPVPKEAQVSVEVAINETVVREVTIKNKLASYKIEVPASALREGENQLFLTYSGEADAVAWYNIDFSPGVAGSRPPTVVQSSRSLFLPFGSQVTLPLMAAPGARLRLEGVEVRGPGRLKVLIHRDDAEEVVHEPEASDEPVDLTLAGEDWVPVRLTLMSLAQGAAGERDGVLLAEPAVWAARRYLEAPPPPTKASGDRPNVLIYLVDTLRADHLGCYGYERPEGPISPRIDGFASKATLFENSVAQTSWTRPAVASIFTGMWPAAHRVNRTKDQLAPQSTTLAEVLQGEGYETLALVANPNVYRRFGLAQGFDGYRHMPGKKAPSNEINAEIEGWLDRREPERPFFLYVHTVDPHDPYEPPEKYRQRFAPGTDELLALPKKARWTLDNREALIDLYDAEIAFNDESFGALMDGLAARDLWDDTLVIFVSDHGEEFQEHGSWTHGRKLFSESVRVPLIIKWPGQKRGERRSDLAQHIDLPSTVLANLGLPWPEAFEGRDLAEPPAVAPSAFLYLNYYGPLELATVRDDWKLLVRVERQTSWLFDLADDPGETTDRTAQGAIRADVLDAGLADALRPRPYWLTAGEAEIDKKLEDQLRALGYLD